MNAILTILHSLPAIIAAIKAIEAEVPGSGQGRAKLDAVLALVTAVDASLGAMLPQLISVIGTLVTLFNSTGAFSKQ